MIIFKTDTIELDLSASGVSLNEENNIFSDSLYRSYSLPFTIQADHDILSKLGLPNIDNISSTESKVKGKLILTDRYYNATLYIGEIQGDIVECDLSYGDEELGVYDLELSELPWPIILTPDIIAYAGAAATKSWPETPCNFPMVYNPKISEKSDYEDFNGFVNNYVGGNYQANITTTDSGTGETLYHNRNVLTPHVYALEILRFIFALEGKQIKGPLVEDELMKKVVFMPKNYLEKFRGSEFQTFSFSTPDQSIQENSRQIGLYSRQFTLQNEGTYDLKFSLNLDPVVAKYFELIVYREDSGTGETFQLLRKYSTNNRVKLEEELKINVEADMVFDFLKIELRLIYTSNSIATGNQFELSFKDGRLNEFPSYFSLSEFMPKMKASEFVNLMKNWLNLDLDHRDSEVIISYTQDSILNKNRVDHRHLEIPKPSKKRNSNRFYKLKYANGEMVYYNSNGQVFSDLDEDGDDVIPINIDVQPAVVEQNNAITTAVLPESNSGFDFCVFDGIQNNKPVASFNLAQDMKLQAVFDRHWETWLRYRVNSKTFKETFDCSVYETINIKELSFKYNELHVIKKLNKKFRSDKVMRVQVESETF